MKYKTNDYAGFMNAVFGSATLKAGEEWIEEASERPDEYNEDLLDDIDSYVNRIMRDKTGGNGWNDDDEIRVCEWCSKFIIKLAFMGVNEPQIAFLVSDLIRFPGVIDFSVKKHGEDVVVDIINKLVEYKDRAMEFLSDILSADDPYEKARELSGHDYEFVTEELWRKDRV